MYDVAGSAKEWWDTVVGRVELVCGARLQASPLQKLRLRPDLHADTIIKHHRVEQRMVAMMVAALPEQFRRDVVAARQMSTCSMFFDITLTPFFKQVVVPSGRASRSSRPGLLLWISLKPRGFGEGGLDGPRSYEWLCPIALS